MYLSVRRIDFAPFYDFSIRFCNCSDSVLFLLFFILFVQCFQLSVNERQNHYIITIQFYYISCKFPVFSLVKERMPI
jgi:hypothetical protein